MLLRRIAGLVLIVLLMMARWRRLGAYTLTDLRLIVGALESLVIGLAPSLRGSRRCAGSLESIGAESWASEPV